MRHMILALGTIFGLQLGVSEAQANDPCIQRAQWIHPATHSQLVGTTLLKQAANQPVVLLGEQHADPLHHQWQLQTLAQLHAHNPNMVIGFEMFPRRVQPVLDAWIRGELSPDEFLQETDWDEIWNFDPAIYMPLFQFAKMNRLPMVALNVDRAIVRRVAHHGWDQLSDADKNIIQKPEPASERYRTYLRDIYKQHLPKDQQDHLDEERFQRFIDAQLTWDGAMAQAIHHVRTQGGNPLVIGIMGSGHLVHRHGVPSQLSALGVTSKVLLPWSLDNSCDDLVPDYADAVFGIEPVTAPTLQRAQLGVRLNKNQDKVIVEEVIEESVAEDAGIKAGDIIQQIAGTPVNQPKDVIDAVQLVAAGLWLPLTVGREGTQIDLIAKFPNPLP